MRRLNKFLKCQSLIACVFLMGCSNGGKPEPKEFTVTWKNDNGNILETDYGVPLGEKPHYDGNTPKKDRTAQYTYTFKGWDGDIDAGITADTTFTAQYNSTVNEYTVTWLDDNGKTLEVDSVPYGEKPCFHQENPQRVPQPSGDKYKGFEFKGWNEDTDIIVTKDLTFTAKWETYECYKISFVNEYADHTLLMDAYPKPNELPVYTGDSPVRPYTDERTKYDFDYWEDDELNKGLKPATKNETYSAVFKPYTCYKIDFVNYDDATLQSSFVREKTLPEYEGETPIRDEDAQYVYTFSGWDKGIQLSTKDETYKATYSTVTKEYTISFVNYDDKVIQSSKFKYGETPVCGITPTKPSDSIYKYTFSGWDHEIQTVTGNATYKAVFNQEKIDYTIKFINCGEDYSTQTLHYGDTVVIPDDPTKFSDEQYDYEFVGWSPEVQTKVRGNATYTAQYRSIIHKYTVTWVNGDTVLEEDVNIPYGTYPSYDGVKPTKKIGEHSCEFIGWSPSLADVTSDITYYALFDENSHLKFTGTNVTINYKTSFVDSGDFGCTFKYTIVPDYGFKLPSNIDVKIDGISKSSSDYSYDSDSGEFSIEGLGNIELSVNGESL